MRKSDIYFTAALVPLDYLAMVGAASAAYFLRYAAFFQRVRPVVFNLPFEKYFSLVLVIALAWIAIFAFSGLYAMSERKFSGEIRRVALACSTGTLAVVLVFFFSRELFSSRFMILASWLFAVVFVLLARLCMRLGKRMYWKHGKGLHAVVLVGNEATARALLSSRFGSPSGGHRIVHQLQQWDESGEQRLKEYAEAGNSIDELVLTDPDITKDRMKSLMDFCTAHQVGFRYTAELLGGQSSNIGVDLIAGIPIIEVRATRLDGWGKVWKRLFDVCVACVGLVVLVPITIVVGSAIILNSRGPVFVRLERIGARGKRFMLYKYRSMIVGAHEMKGALVAQNERRDGPLFKMRNDPRITRVGRFLRRSSIDELPQLWNVLKGDMSLVGPRPHEPQEVSQYEVRQKKLLNVRPGITGMAQVSGRTDLTFAEEARIDMLYVEQWSLLLDIIILLKTPFVLLKYKGV
ncbi:MAG: sugar transferase [Patescibacteria group bacterium]